MTQKKQQTKTARDVATDVVQTAVEVLATGGVASLLKAGAQEGIKQSFKQGMKQGIQKTLVSVDKQGLKQVGKEMLMSGAQKMDDTDDTNMNDVFFMATKGRVR